MKEPVDLRVNGTRLEKDPKPKYLGVTLDQKLTLFDHIQEVKHKASARLGIVKKLAGTKWGAKPNVLRSLYMGAVRSQMDYSLPIQIYASRTSLGSLDAIQNQSIRYVPNHSHHGW